MYIASTYSETLTASEQIGAEGRARIIVNSVR